MMIDLSRTFVSYSNGYITKAIWLYIPILFFLGFTGSWIGQKILNRIPQGYFKRIALLLILLVGLFSLYQSLA
jgi:uncharacterized membrane protein YfcA